MSVHRHLVLRLEAPLLAFGGTAIDNYGPTRDFPTASMLTGLIANALGWRRQDRQAHAALQSRLVFGARREREPYTGTFRDTQNARLHENDRGWTTRGKPEGRAPSPSYRFIDGETPTLGKYLLQRRHRDYHPDALVSVVMRLHNPAATPTLEEIAAALHEPCRPLFFGRKPCLPSAPLLAPDDDGRWIDAPDIYLALSALPWGHRPTWAERRGIPATPPTALRGSWPDGEGPGGDRSIALCDERDWLSGFHSGHRTIVEGMVRIAHD